MANSLIDCLPDAVIITILSFLPTRIAARTSVLSRRFRHLWEASPSLALISRDLPHDQQVNFVAMSNHALLSRNPSYPLLSLRLELSRCDGNASFLSSLLAKAHSLDLRHLTIESFQLSDFLPIAPIIFTINSLRCLSLDLYARRNYYRQQLTFPSGINLTNLRSLSLQFFESDHLAVLNPLVSQLCSLEDLHLHIEIMSGLSLYSKTITKLKLLITYIPLEHTIVNLSLPSLESLHFEIKNRLQCLNIHGVPCLNIHGEVPLLRKSLINIHAIYERDISVFAGMLNFISHVEELSLHLKESKFEKYPIPILLESGKDVLQFHKLEHLHLTLNFFYEHNLEVVTTMLHICPALKSLKLVHEAHDLFCWGSRLPRNADGNYSYAYFNNLHLEENREQVIKLLSKKCSSKGQASK